MQIPTFCQHALPTDNSYRPYFFTVMLLHNENAARIYPDTIILLFLVQGLLILQKNQMNHPQAPK